MSQLYEEWKRRHPESKELLAEDTAKKPAIRIGNKLGEVHDKFLKQQEKKKKNHGKSV